MTDTIVKRGNATMPKKCPPFRADIVGSFLRPAPLIDARRAINEDLSVIESNIRKPDSLVAIEDRAIKDLVKFQEGLGLDVVTDGEFRRLYYFDLLAAFDGVDLIKEEGINFVSGFSPPRVVVRGKVRWPEGGVTVSDFRFLRSLTSRVPKITLPSPLFSQFYNTDRIDRSVYPNLDDFWADIITAYRSELQALADEGCTYVQIDETTLIRLCDPKFVNVLREHGVDPDAELSRWTGILNAITQGMPDHLTIGMHICRGNGPGGSWISSGGYDAIADVIFNRIAVDTYLLEFDTERAGGFEPLRFLPRSKGVVLGLISTKSPQLESESDIKRRVDEATRFVPIENLALSPQCGFSSDNIDRPIDFEGQQRKMELVVKVAKEIWP
jgi:5-methyltetrahydropteroyltriglutamate--homocysteine methyltransferase